MSKTQQQLWTKFGGKEFFARMAENAKNDGEGNEISQTYATKDTATSSTAGLMSGADKAKLDAIGQGAEANVIESISTNGVALPVSGKNVDIPVATDQDDGLLPHEKLSLIPAAAQPGADRVYSFDDANGTSWQTVVKDYFGDLVLDQTGTPVAGEDGSLLYSEDAVQLWLSYKGTEFGARRAYEDHTGENIHDSIAAKPGMAQVNAAIETALANYGGFQVVNIGEDDKPDVDNPSTKYIYLTKDEQSQAEDPYTEWIYTVETQWEKIGETSVDLAPMTGATAQSDGEAGLVPQPLIADKDKFLKGDGTWAAPPEVNLSRYYYDEYNNGLSAKRTAGARPYGSTSLVGSSGNLNSYDMDATFYLDWGGTVQSLFNVNTGDSGLSFIGFGSRPDNDAARRYLLPKPEGGKYAKANAEGKIVWDSVKEVPTSTSADSGKVLSVNQSGSAEWSQHSWTSASKNIPSESVFIGGRKYPTVQIGNQLWITKNLDWKFDGLVVDGNAGVSNISAAWYPNRDEATYGWDGAGYGLLYNEYAARYMNDNNLLPNGWRVPDQADWQTLVTTVSTTGPGAIENNAGLKLKATSVGGTDDYGFSMLLPGMLQSNGFFNGIGSYCANLALWGESGVYNVNTNSIFNYLNYSVSGEAGAGYAVRLVKDVV